MRRTYPFAVRPLPYRYDSLEPYISAETLYFHHDKHYYTYVQNLNKTLEKRPELKNMTLEELLRLKSGPTGRNEQVLRNAGGVYNHEMYFDSLTSEESNPSGALCREAVRTFGSEEGLKKILSEIAAGVFGSGYAWLAATENKRILVVSYKNQENPIMYNLCPLLPIDVWEHAYYLDYQNRRDDYIDNWYRLVNWDAVNRRYTGMN